MPLIDITGQRFGRLTVLQRLEGAKKYSRWLCACECGREAKVLGDNLRNGRTQSCGCLRLGCQNAFKHGASRRKKHTPEYRSWTRMLCRCLNRNHKDYHRYGGRGIAVCARWNDFASFLADMGPRPGGGRSIDRINNDGNYELSNCRWATPKEQAQNRRRRRR